MFVFLYWRNNTISTGLKAKCLNIALRWVWLAQSLLLLQLFPHTFDDLQNTV